ASAIPLSLSPALPAFQEALGAVLNDPTFLPGGGYLGFGLERQYPLPGVSQTSLAPYRRLLKGSDAMLMAAADHACLEATINLYYAVDRYEDDKYDGVLCDFIPEEPGGAMDTEGDQSFHHTLLWDGGSPVLSAAGYEDVDEANEDEFSWIAWVTPVTSHTQVKSGHLFYGNEASLEWEYGDLCLAMKVGPYGSRSTA
ncbi:hypothetical protein EIP91_005823, partial [Steccherinum ochraceum]